MAEYISTGIYFGRVKIEGKTFHYWKIKAIQSFTLRSGLSGLVNAKNL
ncbi:MAG: hypothetical protein WDM76_14810 [Limisphaerales bacterium]